MVTRPTFRLIGERGPEAVIPLHRAGAMGGGNQVSVSVNVNGGGDWRQVAEETGRRVRDELLRAGRGRMALRRAARRGL